MSAQKTIKALREERDSLYKEIRLMAKTAELYKIDVAGDIEVAAFIRKAMNEDPHVKQVLYQYRKSGPKPAMSFSTWCVKGMRGSCRCWRCLSDQGEVATRETEIAAMGMSATLSRFNMDKLRVQAETGDAMAVAALAAVAEMISETPDSFAPENV